MTINHNLIQIKLQKQLPLMLLMLHHYHLKKGLSWLPIIIIAAAIAALLLIGLIFLVIQKRRRARGYNPTATTETPAARA